MSATLRILTQGPAIIYDPKTPLPQGLPSEIDPSKLKQVEYQQLAGQVSFGDSVYMGWLLVTDTLSKNEEKALKAQGWALQNKQPRKQWWWLEHKEIHIPLASERPESWPPAHLEVVQKGVRLFGVRDTPHVDFVRVRWDVPSSWGFFVTQDQYPVLPLRVHGEIQTRGWDIPTCYAIDANGKCWKDNGHGPNLLSCGVEEILGELETSEERSNIRRLLGMKEEMPQWMRWALAEGWTPPEGWDSSKYE